MSDKASMLKNPIEMIQFGIVRAGADLYGVQALVEGLSIEDGNLEYSLRRELEEAVESVEAAEKRVIELIRSGGAS
jgi:quinol monooxygenase YgiN